MGLVRPTNNRLNYAPQTELQYMYIYTHNIYVDHQRSLLPIFKLNEL